MSFSDIHIPLSINSSKADPVDEFFIPILKQSKKYDVAVGYFSTSWIRDAAEGIAELAANGGKTRWVISPQLTKDDWELLSSIENTKEKKLHVDKLTELSIDNLINELESNTRTTLAWMIAEGIFEFRLAIPTNDLHGIFHAKIGIFEDDQGNKVAISGSYNLTGAANTNWETIEIFSSLEGEYKRIEKKIEEFSMAWDGTDPNLKIYKPSDRALDKFIKITELTDCPYKKKKKQPIEKKPRIPEKFLNNENKLRKHQEKAITSWFEKGRGIFAMATGSGKTVTALSAVTRLYKEIENKNSSLFVIITVPLKHLAEQWKEEAQAFGFNPVMCFSDYKEWPNETLDLLNELRLGLSNIGVIITVNATFFGEKFQNYIQKIDIPNLLLIADEMHNLGSEEARTKLPANAKFRIGLSATPKRHLDEIGTKALYDYFGEQVIDYGIKEAIDDGTLTPYYYHPIVVEFTYDEMAKYTEISQKIASIFGKNKDGGLEDNPFLKQLLMERARLIAGAENKLKILKSELAKYKEENYILVYVGATKVEDERQIEEVLKIVGKELGMRARKFTADETQNERKEILATFASGELQVIVAIKCLDEGVDIPKTEIAYILASTTNPREFIQRRGRVLRCASGKKYAKIYDFVVVPPISSIENYGTNTFSVERKLFKRELERITEFASVAENKGTALSKIRDVKLRLNLLDI